VSQPVPFIQLRSEARQLVDQNLPNTFISETNLGTLINRSAMRLYNKLVQLAGDNYAWSTTSLTTAVNQDTYPLSAIAADFWKLIGVKLVTSAIGAAIPTTIKIRRLMNDEIDLYSNVIAISWAQLGFPNVRYDLIGGIGNTPESLLFRPLPVPGNQVVNIIYAPILQPMVADSDTFLFGQWAEWICTDTALKAAAIDRDFEMVTYLAARLNELTAEVDSSAENRDSGEPMRIIDVTKDSGAGGVGLFPGGWI
jgi:hypothetical protein